MKIQKSEISTARYWFRNPPATLAWHEAHWRRPWTHDEYIPAALHTGDRYFARAPHNWLAIARVEENP